MYTADILAERHVDPSVWIAHLTEIYKRITHLSILKILLVYRAHPEVYPGTLPYMKIQDIIDTGLIGLRDHNDLILRWCAQNNRYIPCTLPELPQNIIDELYILATEHVCEWLVDNYIPSFEAAKSILSQYPQCITHIPKLIKNIDASTEDSFLLRQAVKDNNVKYVKLYLKDGKADPSVRNQWCYKHATQMKYEEIRLALLADNRVVITQSRRKNIPY